MDGNPGRTVVVRLVSQSSKAARLPFLVREFRPTTTPGRGRENGMSVRKEGGGQKKCFSLPFSRPRHHCQSRRSRGRKKKSVLLFLPEGKSVTMRFMHPLFSLSRTPLMRTGMDRRGAANLFHQQTFEACNDQVERGGEGKESSRMEKPPAARE